MAVFLPFVSTNSKISSTKATRLKGNDPTLQLQPGNQISSTKLLLDFGTQKSPKNS